MKQTILQSAIEAAEKELSALEAERLAMSGSSAAIAAAADASGIVRISARKKELPVFIIAAKIRLTSLLIQEGQANKEALELESESLKSIVDDAQAGLEAARSARDAALGAYNNVRNKINGIEGHMDDKQRLLESLRARLDLIAK